MWRAGIFSQGSDLRSAAEIRIAAALLKIEAGRHGATNKTELVVQAQGLDQLATEVAKVWSNPRSS
jgi:hypothetical protein